MRRRVSADALSLAALHEWEVDAGVAGDEEDDAYAVAAAAHYALSARFSIGMDKTPQSLGGLTRAGAGGRALHSSTYQLNLNHFCHQRVYEPHKKGFC
jgi:hypothetical protein